MSANALNNAREHAQEVCDLANVIRNAIDAGVYHSAQEKLDLLVTEITELSEALRQLRIMQKNPPNYQQEVEQERQPRR